jgi:solute carrier family 13 (sodium-dependent dicarboxylate transporter), member 2/3/5
VASPDPLDESSLPLSAAEERFDLRRRTLGLFLGPLAFALTWLAPFPALTPEAHRLAAIVALVVVWWITEAIPIAITAVVGPALAVATGVAPAQQAFAPFASPTVFLFLGSFMLGRAVTEHGLDRRLALGLLSLPAMGRSPGRILVGVGVMTMAISGWMSNTATTAMMLPVALGLVRTGPAAGSTGSDARTRGYRIGLLLTIAYAASIGGMLTPVGSPPNLITIGLLETATGRRIDFVRWMLFAAPLVALMAVVMFALVRFRLPAPPAGATERTSTGLSPWTVGQRNCALAFGVAVTLWVVPGLVALVAPDSPARKLLATRLDEAVVAVLAATLLFVLPTHWASRTFTLDWRQASRIDWGTLLLFGGGLSLGSLMFETGLAKVIGNGLAEALGAESRVAVIALAAALGVVLSELTSNTAATNMVVPVVISLCQARGLDPTTPALAACFGASLGFMLPISTPPNAIVYGTGLIPIGRMFSTGILLDALGLVVVIGGLLIFAPG